MPISRSAIAKQLIPGLNKVFGGSYKDVPDQCGPLFTKEKSNRSFEEEVMYTGLGTATEKFEGDAVQMDEMRETYSVTYNHVTIALGFAITEEAVEDNLYAEMGKRKSGALGRALGVTKQIRGADVFNNAFDNNYKGGDGVSLFSNAHPTLTGDQTNIPASHADLSETSLETAVIDVNDYRDERGILINAMVKTLHIPSELRFVAERVLKTTSSTVVYDDTNGVTNKNDINALKSMGMFSGGVYMNNRFTDPSAWFIRTDVTDGLKHFQRVALAAGSEGDFDTGNFRYKARERYSFGWSDWRNAYGTSGAA